MRRCRPATAAALLLGVALLLQGLGTGAAGAAAAWHSQKLFRIERSKNANVVQYDARLGPDGQLDPREPVDAYWLRLAHDGHRKELEWLERKLAFGFRAKLDRSHREARLDMAADIGRPIAVRHIGDRYRAEMEIDGRPAVLDRVFVHSEETALLPRVLYIDLFGTDVETGQPRHERLRP